MEKNKSKNILKIIGIPDNNQVELAYNDGFLKEFLLNFDGNSSFLENVSTQNAKITTLYVGGKQHFQNFELEFKPDVIVNMICNPEIHTKSLLIFENINFKAPIINHPKYIKNTSRDIITQNLQSTENFIIPKTYRITPKNKKEIADFGKKYFGKKYFGKNSFLFRPVSSHGGDGLFKIDNIKNEEFNQYILDGKEEYFLTEFVDFKSSDGVYKKARFFVIDGKAYPRHYIASTDWKIHSQKRELLEDTAEEESFLKNPPKIFLEFCEYIYNYLQLDYFGIDCAVLPNNQVVLFEANICMRPKGKHTQPYLQEAYQNILNKFGELLWKRV